MPTSDELDALITRIAKEMESYDPDSLGDDPAEFDSWLLLSDARDALSALRDTNPDEWEYGVNRSGRGNPDAEPFTAADEADADNWIAGEPGTTKWRRRKAGPWLPVPSSPEGSK